MFNSKPFSNNIYSIASNSSRNLNMNGSVNIARENNQQQNMASILKITGEQDFGDETPGLNRIMYSEGTTFENIRGLSN